MPLFFFLNFYYEFLLESIQNTYASYIIFGTQIVLQDSVEEDSSTGNGVLERPENDLPTEECPVVQEEFVEVETEAEYIEGFSDTDKGRKREMVERGAPFLNSLQNDISEGDENLQLSEESPVQYRPSSEER